MTMMIIQRDKDKEAPHATSSKMPRVLCMSMYE